MAGLGAMHFLLTISTLLLCLPNSWAGDWIVETQSMVIRAPPSIAGIEDAAIGDFGVPLYGASMLGEVHQTPDNSFACDPFASFTHSTHDLPPVLLVPRGGCYFIEKAYNAEQAGYKGILIYDNIEERLLTMAAPEDRPEIAKLADDISIPTALLTHATGTKMVKALSKGSSVVVELDFTESLAHPDKRVEWEFWTSSNDGCGPSCDRQSRFKTEFAQTATNLEKNQYTQFKPRFMVQHCLDNESSPSCISSCINKGRYCAVDTIAEDLKHAYKGRDVMEENKRQLCIRQQAEARHQSWLWWSYVKLFNQHCRMRDNTFNEECATRQIEAVNLTYSSIQDCMGDSDADHQHPLLQAEFEAQGTENTGASASRIVLLPTVVINDKQYRGRLDALSITKALCAGFKESTEPEICLSGSIQNDDCASGNQACWSNATAHADACLDTFRGYICQCPQGWRGNGETCQDIDECAEGTSGCDHTCINLPGSYQCQCDEGFNLFGGQGTPGFCYPKNMCGSDNGGCEGPCYSTNGTSVCSCGQGLRLAEDGMKCVDVDECAEGLAHCEQQCINKDPRRAGVPFSCACNLGFSADLGDPSQCIKTSEFLSKMGVTMASASWASIAAISGAAAAVFALAGYAAQRLRMRRHMHDEIHEIMRQYMPLESPEEAGDRFFVGSSQIAAYKPQALAGRDLLLRQGEDQA